MRIVSIGTKALAGTGLVVLTLMAQSLKMFEIVHGDAGWAAINAIITVNGLLWAAMSVRREILA